MYKYVICLISVPLVLSFNFSLINLPDDHIATFFSNNPKLAQLCQENKDCLYKKLLNKGKCWGYEYGCGNQYSKPDCPGDHKGWVQTKEDQEKTFYTQADFGYIKQQSKEMKVICEPMFPDDSSLECTDHLRFCRGRNLMINFTSLIHRDEPIRYKMDVLNDGDIGGYCNFYKERIDSQLDHMSPLQSWAPELRRFTRFNQRPIVENKCDVIVEKPTFIMKIDAINMYHHFCDFINLYGSQHLNNTDINAFSKDVHILVWETFTYKSAFESTFEAFTDHPIWDLKTFRGQTVCFKNIIFPLLPRMIFGLYYNTPVIYGCQNSGLFHAFSEHVLHRLQIPVHKRDDKIRVTLLSRDTKYRKILNEKELIAALEADDDYLVKRVVFNRDVGFKSQLEIIRNSDVLIGMHGAGLTHSMFMPDWAAVFELYNCEDANCYSDLTRLRGLKYVTWENPDKLIQEDEGTHPEGGAHAKFTNYSFDVNEFIRLVRVATEHVNDHPKFNAYMNTILNYENNQIDKPENEECQLNFGTAEPIDVDDIEDQIILNDYEEYKIEIEVPLKIRTGKDEL